MAGDDGTFAYRLDLRDNRRRSIAELLAAIPGWPGIEGRVRVTVLRVALAVGRFRRYVGKGWVEVALTPVVIWGLYMSLARLYFVLKGVPLVFWWHDPWQKTGGVFSADAFLGWFAGHIPYIVDKTFKYGWLILALYCVFFIFLTLWRVRNNVEIKDFTGTNPEKPKVYAEGINDLLIVEMGRLRKLYMAVDERQPVPSGWSATDGAYGGPMDVLFQVADASSFLDGFFTQTSELTIASYKIPIGSVLAVIKQAVQGPRISGSMYFDNYTLVIAAQYSGGEHSYSWRVTRVFPEKYDVDRESAIVIGMVRDLACQMFADLVLGGCVRSGAVSVFSEGLERYRDSLSTAEDTGVNLLDAEAKFIEAFSIDTTYHMVYHNLGVVYLARKEYEQARRSFMDSIKWNPSYLEAYYGLARVQFRQGRCEEAIKQCNFIIASSRSRWEILARAYDLKASIIVRAGRPSGYCDALACREKAVRASWISLCYKYIRGRDARQCEKTYYGALRNLARNLGQIAEAEPAGPGRNAGFRRAETTYGEALSVSDPPHCLHFELGRLYQEKGSSAAAAVEFERAIRSCPDNPKYWAYYAYACAHLCRKGADIGPIDKAASRVWEYSLAAIGGLYDRADTREALDIMRQTCEKLMAICPEATDNAPGASAKSTTPCKDHVEWGQRIIGSIEGLLEVVDLIDDAKKDRAARDKLKEMMPEGLPVPAGIAADLPDKHAAMVSGIKAVKYGLLQYHGRQYGDAEKFFRQAVGYFGTHPHLIDYLGLHCLIADSILKDALTRKSTDETAALVESRQNGNVGATDPSRDYRSNDMGAMKEAENAVWSNAPGPGGWLALGRVNYMSENYYAAIKALKKEMEYEYIDPDVYYLIGASYISLAMYGEEAGSDPLIERAIDYLNKAIRLCGKGDLNDVRYQSHFWLGFAHEMRGDMSEALYHFNTACKFSSDTLVPRLFAGYTYYKNNEMANSLNVLNALARAAMDEIIKKERVQDRNYQYFGMSLGYPMSYLDIAERSYFYMAYIYIDQDIDVSQVKEYTATLKTLYDLIKNISYAPEQLREYEAEINLCEGWLNYKESIKDSISTVFKDKNPAGDGKTDKKQAAGSIDEGKNPKPPGYSLDYATMAKAIESYESSVALMPTDSAYYLLALAHEALYHAVNPGDPAAGMACKAKIQACCQSAKRINKSGHYESRITDLLSRVTKPASGSSG